MRGLRPWKPGRRMLGALGLGMVAGGAALVRRWGLLCTSAIVWQRVNRVCIEHMSGEALGNLCQALCILNDVQSVSCHHNLGSSESAFTGHWNSKRLLFKSPKKTTVFEPKALYWVDEKNVRHYPSNAEFKKMIKELVMTKVNISISDEIAEELGHLPKGDTEHLFNRHDDIIQRTIEMDNIWVLLQDSDYILTILYSRTDLFPKRIGTCGTIYAVEHAEPLKAPSALFALDESKEEWERRSRLAVLILELLDKFEKAKLRICDVELSHFGSSGGKLKYLELSSIRSKGTACYPGERGNKDNLQAVCERVYLGWVVRARIVVPGLLVSKRAPTALATILRRCADPEAPVPSKELKRALYNTLVKKH